MNEILAFVYKTLGFVTKLWALYYETQGFVTETYGFVN